MEVHCENFKRQTSYKRAQLLWQGFAVATLGLSEIARYFGRHMEKPIACTPHEPGHIRKPSILLPQFFYHVKDVQIQEALQDIIEAGILEATGQDNGRVYHPTEQLWQVTQ